MNWQRTLLLTSRQFCLEVRRVWGVAYLDALVEQAKKELAELERNEQIPG